MEQRENWGSRFGFIMTAAGFSIGLGNIWRFPYLVGTSGGGAFVLIYIIVVLCIGIPLFVMEMTLGRKSQASPVAGMRKLTRKGSPWVSFGWLGVIAAFVILTYYIQVMGWILAYFFKMVGGSFEGMTKADQFQSAFANFQGSTALVIGLTLACSLLIGFISSKGLEDGVEKSCKFLMPTLFTMLIIMAIRSLTLPGAMKGLEWYLKPDFSRITKDVWLDALGQAFFSVGIASGGAFIYGSYLKKDSDIPTDAVIIVAFDSLAALIAGIVIFPAVFAYNLEPGQGHGLLFATMSNMFTMLPGGRFFGAMFFLLVFFAALSSALGYLEPIVTTGVDVFHMNRKKSVWVSLGLIFIVGLPTIMAFGPWSDKLIGGRNFFEFADYLSGNICMPLGALVVSFYALFVWKFKNFQHDANAGSKKLHVYNWWKILVNGIIPVALVIIFCTCIF